MELEQKELSFEAKLSLLRSVAHQNKSIPRIGDTLQYRIPRPFSVSSFIFPRRGDITESIGYFVVTPELRRAF